MDEHEAAVATDDAMRNTRLVDHEGSSRIIASFVALLTLEHVDEFVTLVTVSGYFGAWRVAQERYTARLLTFVEHVNFHPRAQVLKRE